VPRRRDGHQRTLSSGDCGLREVGNALRGVPRSALEFRVPDDHHHTAATGARNGTESVPYRRLRRRAYALAAGSVTGCIGAAFHP
jgi:hypothetical protein